VLVVRLRNFKLQTQASGAIAIGGKISALEQQPRWPNEDNPRCFIFTDPFGREG